MFDPRQGRFVMQTLPYNVQKYRQTPEFDETGVPAGLLKAHQTPKGTWGRIVIVSGQLAYRILAPEAENVVLSEELYAIVEPVVPHQVKPPGNVKVYVEFYREPAN